MIRYFHGFKTIIDASQYIHQILTPPQTINENKTSIKCLKNENENIVSIVTTFAIESTTNDDTEIIYYLMKIVHSLQNQERHYLKYWIGVEFTDIHEITKTGIELRIVISIIAGALFVIISCIICIVHRYKKNKGQN